MLTLLVGFVGGTCQEGWNTVKELLKSKIFLSSLISILSVKPIHWGIWRHPTESLFGRERKLCFVLSLMIIILSNSLHLNVPSGLFTRQESLQWWGKRFTAFSYNVCISCSELNTSSYLNISISSLGSRHLPPLVSTRREINSRGSSSRSDISSIG